MNQLDMFKLKILSEETKNLKLKNHIQIMNRTNDKIISTDLSSELEPLFGISIKNLDDFVKKLDIISPDSITIEERKLFDSSDQKFIVMANKAKGTKIEFPLLESDEPNEIEDLSINNLIDGVEPSTGKAVKLRITKDIFTSLSKVRSLFKDNSYILNVSKGEFSVSFEDKQTINNYKQTIHISPLFNFDYRIVVEFPYHADWDLYIFPWVDRKVWEKQFVVLNNDNFGFVLIEK